MMIQTIPIEELKCQISLIYFIVFFEYYRDFAYVARDKVTKRYKCHVFRCDIPAKAIANALHEICARVMSERQKGHTISMVTQGQMIQQQQQQQLMQMRSISLDSNKAPTPTAGMTFDL